MKKLKQKLTREMTRKDQIYDIGTGKKVDISRQDSISGYSGGIIRKKKAKRPRVSERSPGFSSKNGLKFNLE